MERKPFRILAIAGSLRKGSFNQGLLRAAQEEAPEWVEVQFFDIGQLPFFNEDIETSGDSEPVRRFNLPRAATPVSTLRRSWAPIKAAISRF